MAGAKCAETTPGRGPKDSRETRFLQEAGFPQASSGKNFQDGAASPGGQGNRPAETPAATKAKIVHYPAGILVTKQQTEIAGKTESAPHQYNRDAISSPGRRNAIRRGVYTPLSDRLIDMPDLPDSVKALLSYDQITGCKLKGVLNMSRMACLLRQLAQVSPRYYQNSGLSGIERTLNSLYRTCSECRHYVPDEDYDAVRGRLGHAVRTAGKGKDSHGAA